MEANTPDIEKVPEAGGLSEDKIRRFQILGNTFFNNSGEVKNSFFDNIHEKLNYKFPQKDSKYNDFILPPKAIPLTLIYDTNLLKYYENWLKLESAVNTASISVYNVAKDYYFRWAIAKDAIEKAKNRNLLKDICEKNLDDRIFFIFIFNALIDVSESRINTELPNMLLKIQRIAEPLKLEPELKNKIYYITNILFGIYYLKSKDLNYAKVKFNDSLDYSPSGNTAKFYLAYIELKSDNLDEAFDYVKEIFYFDAERIAKAIGYNDFKQYLFYIKCAEFNNILAENEFALLIDKLEELFKEIESKVKLSAIILDGFLRRIKQMGLEEFYEQDTVKYFAFLETVLIHFLSKENFFFKITLQYFKQYLNECISQLITSVTNDYNKIVEKKLEVYDYNMSDDYEEIIRIQNALEKEKASKEEFINHSIQNLENEIAKTITECKSKLESIDKDDKYNVKRVFSNAMLYNTILSFVIIIIGGFVNLTRNPEVKESTQLVDVTQSAIESGFKWGGAIFFFGCIVSVIMVFITIASKSRLKTKLANKIRYQARYKAEEIEKIRTKKENELESNIEKSNIKIEKFKRHIESLKEQKKEEEQLLKESADSKIEEYQKQLNDILTAY